jgi:hypothetical protein
MILTEHIPHLHSLQSYMRPPMLMLGRQTNTSAYRFPCDYKTLDPDGGDFPLSLAALTDDEMDRHREAWATVFNLGTLEHIWDAHQAHVDAASMVKIGGHFLGQVPVAGWEGHGIHITSSRQVLDFFELNEFHLESFWFTTQAGALCEAPRRNGGKSILLWFAAKRMAPLFKGIWRKPSQVYVDGKKPA